MSFGIVVSLLSALGYYYFVLETRSDLKRYFRWLVLFFAVSSTLLVMMSTLFKGDYALHYRYYSPFTPLLLLFYARAGYLVVTSDRSALRLAGGLTMVIALLGVFLFAGREVYRTALDEDLRFHQGIEYLASTTDEIRGDEPAVYIGGMQIFAAADKLPVVPYLGRWYWPHAFASESTWLFVVHHREVGWDGFNDKKAKLEECLRPEKSESAWMGALL